MTGRAPPRSGRDGLGHPLGCDHGDWGASLDIPDPDGTVLRFLANNPFTADRFIRVETGPDGQPTFYDTPRLTDRLGGH